MYWLFQARKRYKLCVLNYIVTSNHIHLLVYEGAGGQSIPSSMQLIAGRTGQDFNQRKKRGGAFWEDRYHATAIDSDAHLLKCMSYIDLNMVRAGVVDSPDSWPHCGHNEIQHPSQRTRIIDRDMLKYLLQIKHDEDLHRTCSDSIHQLLINSHLERDCRWTESIAVGSKNYINQFQYNLGE